MAIGRSQRRIEHSFPAHPRFAAGGVLTARSSSLHELGICIGMFDTHCPFLAADPGSLGLCAVNVSHVLKRHLLQTRPDVFHQHFYVMKVVNMSCWSTWSGSGFGRTNILKHPILISIEEHWRYALDFFPQKEDSQQLAMHQLPSMIDLGSYSCTRRSIAV